jgi:fatty-acyl-CoA synthase
MQLSNRTLGQWLEHWAETTPDKEYIVYSDRNLRFTWREFNKRVDDMAKGLIAIGVERNSHVGIWAANVPDWLTLLYACAKIGAVYVTVNTNYKQATNPPAQQVLTAQHGHITILSWHKVVILPSN